MFGKASAEMKEEKKIRQQIFYNANNEQRKLKRRAQKREREKKANRTQM